ncbi:MAG: hypothetical protein AB1531_02750 [Chloroflexota bacterium]
MAASFDLNLLPFHRIKGQEWPQLPGLQVCAPPKRAARGRQDDRLVIYLTLAGNTPFSSAEYNQLTARLAERFYKTAGALTSALRAGAEAINQFLVDRNVRTTGKGQYVIGRLILGVLRGSELFLAQSGPTHVFHLTGGESRHVHEEQPSGRVLGASQTTPVYFSQAELHPGDILALCAALPSGWQEALGSAGGSAFDALRRKLLSVSGDDLNAILVQVQAGNGELTVLRPAPLAGEARRAAAPRPAPDQEPAAAQPAPAVPQTSPPAPSRPASQVASGQPASRFARLLAGQADEKPPAEEKAQSAPPSPPVQDAPAEQPARPIPRPPGTVAKPQAVRPGRFVTTRRASGSEVPEISRPASPKRQQVFRGLAKWLRGVRVLSHNTSEKIRIFLPHLLPNLREEQPQVTGMSMMFIAIVIPLLVVMAAMTFYNKHGKTASYQENFDQAWAASVWASAQTDPADIRVGWERTLYYLNIADDYLETEEANELRLRAQTALDNLDSILRLDFSPAIVGGLSQTVEVSRLAATSTDLYLLDAARGNVQRYYAGAQGYQPDTQFNCMPGLYNDGIQVGRLIDILAAPKINSYSATLIALDASGNLLFCRPSPFGPIAVHLAAPELGWEGINGMALDISSNYIYVLDTAGNAIWYYAPDSEGKYTNLPVMFFGAQVPANMNAVIDLATNGIDMYMLFSDGHVTACALFEFQGVVNRCADPVPFTDNRPDRTAGVTIADAYFTQLSFAEPPDQSLYLFDPLTQAVYRFSQRTDTLILQGQFRASEEDRASMFESVATALAISPNRYIFISVKGQVYYATDVP